MRKLRIIRKAKRVFYVLIFKIPIIKKWYIGHGYLKNPPTVYSEKDVSNMTFTNTCLAPNSNTIVSNCNFKNTLKLSHYFQ